MKRLLSVMLALSLLFVLTACGSNNAPKDDKKEEKTTKSAFMQSQSTSEECEIFFAHLESGNYQDAIDYYYENIYGNSENETRSNSLCNNYYQYINREFLAGKITQEQAEIEIDKILRVTKETYIDYGETNDDRFEEIKASKSNYALGCNAFDNNNYLKAYEYLSLVVEGDCNYDDAQTKTAEILKEYKTKALADAEEKAKEEDYPAACEILIESQVLLKDDIDIQAALDNYENIYVTNIITEAEAAFVTPATDWEKAIEIINQAQQYFPENEDLKVKEEYYNKYRPVDLTTLESYAQSSVEIDEFTGGRYDTLGNRYETGFRTLQDNPIPYVIFDLNKEFNTFSAVGFVEKSDKGYAGSVSIKIYGDNELIFSKKVTSDMKPFDINLDITGIQDLKIELCGSFNGWDGMYATIGNVMLQRTVK